MEGMIPIKRALISVSNKEGIAWFANGLQGHDVEIISTGGTAKILREAGSPVIEISNLTGFPEMLDGRVKTLHPKIHGGILFRRDRKDHLEQLKRHGIEPIDMVVVNLYPFQKTVSKPGCSLEEAIEQIDIGGPAMVRAAAKNYKAVAVVVDPEDYRPILKEMDASGGRLSLETTYWLATKAFRLTAAYDNAISEYLESKSSADQR